jgi:hypothetical protein
LTLAATPWALADGKFSIDGKQASSALDFRIVVPPVLRLLENSYPAQLPVMATGQAQISSQQRVVLVSTLGKGFCMDLQLTQPGVTAWQVRADANPEVRVQPSEGGYRLCAQRAGRFDVALQHNFSLSDNSQGDQLGWPVQISLSSL